MFVGTTAAGSTCRDVHLYIFILICKDNSRIVHPRVHFWLMLISCSSFVPLGCTDLCFQDLTGLLKVVQDACSLENILQSVQLHLHNINDPQPAALLHSPATTESYNDLNNTGNYDVKWKCLWNVSWSVFLCSQMTFQHFILWHAFKFL